MRSGRAELGAAALAAALLAACGGGLRSGADDEAPLRIERSVGDARDPVERGGERSVPGSGQLLDEMRLRAE